MSELKKRIKSLKDEFPLSARDHEVLDQAIDFMKSAEKIVNTLESEVSLKNRINELATCPSSGEIDIRSVAVMQAIIDNVDDIDPYSSSVFKSSILNWLKRDKMYGEDIWVLHENVCHKDIVKTYTILRAVQGGTLLSETDMRSAMSGEKTVDTSQLLNALRNRFSGFAKNYQDPLRSKSKQRVRTNG